MRTTVQLASTASRFIILLALMTMGAHGEELARSEGSDLKPIVVGDLERIEVFPPSVQLIGVREKVQFVVTGYDREGAVQDLTRAADFTSSDPGVLSVDSAVARPRGDGVAEVMIRVGDVAKSVAVDVSEQDQSRPVSFEYGVLAALSKQGCNSGACHGSPSGKGGFRLSLRAFDPELDRLTLVREHIGRRVNFIEPNESLLLLKPRMKVSHGGGKRLQREDPAYKILHDWIAEGGRTAAAEQLRCVRLEVFPPSGRLLEDPAHTQQLSVQAHFSDGSVRDVTELAVYSSSNEEVASVAEGGLVVGKGRGEAAVIVRYLEFIESSLFTFVENVEGYRWQPQPRFNEIDAHVDAKLRQLQYSPAPVCRDDEFIRRAYLDLLGSLPPIEGVEKFCADETADKRSQLMDRLLEHPDFAKFWALQWGDLLRMTKDQLGEDGVYKFHRWIERALADNMPYDQFARQLLTAQGSTHVNPAANFYRTAVDPNDCVETVSQVFLGARLQCAKCHNHPSERWTQDNYYGLAAFFNRVRRKNTPKPGESFVWVARSGEVTQPRTGEKMKPWLPAQGEIEPQESDDRRARFAEWLTRPENPYFARIEVNRIWNSLFGQGIVDPPDDFRDSNPPSNPALLAALAEDFIDSGYDRKQMIRTIMNSRTYQASVRTDRFNRDDTKYFSHRRPRLLSAEQLLDAITRVTAVAEPFSGFPEGTKATHLPAPDVVNSPFLKDFGQPQRKTVCECERSGESNLKMAIQFYNGSLIDSKLKHAENRFRKAINMGKSNEQVLTELYLAAYSRPPTVEEMATYAEFLASKQTTAGDQAEGSNADTEQPDAQARRAEAFEDVCWAILTSNEFLLQH